MRHEQVALRESFELVDPSRVRSAARSAVRAEQARPAASIATPAVPDMPVALGRMIVGIYLALIGVFYLTMATGREATFMITVSGLYVCMFFAVPRVLLSLEKDPSRRPSLSRFMSEGIVTWTGHMSGWSALSQIFVVPLALAIGLFAMGLTALWYL